MCLSQVLDDNFLILINIMWSEWTWIVTDVMAFSNLNWHTWVNYKWTELEDMSDDFVFNLTVFLSNYMYGQFDLFVTSRNHFDGNNWNNHGWTLIQISRLQYRNMTTLLWSVRCIDCFKVLLTQYHSRGQLTLTIEHLHSKLLPMGTADNAIF